MTAGIALCAGFGTRLKPVTDIVPKPAVPFMGHPIVWYALHEMRLAGIEHIAANVHHLPEKMSQTLETCRDELGFESLSIFNEEGEIRGTAGGARGCLQFFKDESTFVIYHGDVLCHADLSDVLRQHKTSGCKVTLVVAPRPYNTKLGMVGAANGHVMRIRDWYAHDAQNIVLEPCCFTGIHVIEREVLASVNPTGYACLVTEIYPSLMASGVPIGAYRLHNSFFADVGTPQTYMEAQTDILQHPEKLPDAKRQHGKPMFEDLTGPDFIIF